MSNFPNASLIHASQSTPHETHAIIVLLEAHVNLPRSSKEKIGKSSNHINPVKSATTVCYGPRSLEFRSTSGGLYLSFIILHRAEYSAIAVRMVNGN